MRKAVCIMLDEKTIEVIKKRKREQGIAVSRTIDFALDEYLKKMERKETKG